MIADQADVSIFRTSGGGSGNDSAHANVNSHENIVNNKAKLNNGNKHQSLYVIEGDNAAI